MKILKFRPYEKNTLRGFLELELASGMAIREMTVHEKEGKMWFNFPAKEYEKEDGSTGYSNLVFFPNKERYYRFQDQLLTAFKIHMASQGQRTGTDDNEMPF